jgi:hypothetical protein
MCLKLVSLKGHHILNYSFTTLKSNLKNSSLHILRKFSKINAITLLIYNYYYYFFIESDFNRNKRENGVKISL